MEVNLVNVDYEYELFPHFNQGVMSEKLNKEFNYLYFWLGQKDTHFFSSHSYNDDYLTYLSQFIFELPHVVMEETLNEKKWWGEDFSLLGKKINSKIFATVFAKSLSLCPDTVEIIKNLKELQSYLINYNDKDQFFIRKDVSFSSFGHQCLLKENILSSNLDFPFVIAPFFKRQSDFGNHYIHGEYFIRENILNDRGEFKGCFCHEPSISFNEDLKPVVHHLNKLGVKGDFEIDSFLYQKDGEVHSYPLVEINYRKSLGRMGIALKRLLEPGYCGAWLLLRKNRESETFKEMKKFVSEFEFFYPHNIVITNDLSGNFAHLFFSAPTENELSKLIIHFAKAYYRGSVPKFLLRKFSKDFHD